MQNIDSKAKELKSKVLDIIERKLAQDNITIQEIRECVECINAVQKDEMAYWKNIANTFNDVYNNTDVRKGENNAE